MSEVARTLSEQVRATTVAAEQIRAARGALNVFSEMSEIDPQTVFSHSVREHRALFDDIDNMLRALCYDSRDFESVANDAGFGPEAVKVFRAAHLRLRVLRALISFLIGDSKPLEKEEDSVRLEVMNALRSRATENGANWSNEELELLEEDPRPLSAAFEARLTGA
jgi:hypothetical protein